MFYHVRITPVTGRGNDLVWLDLSEETLNQRVVTPYLQGRPIVIAGETIEIDDVRRVRVSRTKDSSATLLPAIRAERAASHVKAPSISDEWYVAKNAEDVTDQYINQPAGSASTDPVSPSANTSATSGVSLPLVFGLLAVLIALDFVLSRMPVEPGVLVGLKSLIWGGALSTAVFVLAVNWHQRNGSSGRHVVVWRLAATVSLALLGVSAAWTLAILVGVLTSPEGLPSQALYLVFIGVGGIAPYAFFRKRWSGLLSGPITWAVTLILIPVLTSLTK